MLAGLLHASNFWSGRSKKKIETRATCTADEELSDEGRRIGAYRWLLVSCRSASFGGAAPTDSKAMLRSRNRSIITACDLYQQSRACPSDVGTPSHAGVTSYTKGNNATQRAESCLRPPAARSSVCFGNMIRCSPTLSSGTCCS